MTEDELLKRISKMDDKQRDALEKYIEFEVYPDEEEVEVAGVKKKLYREYSKSISGLVAKAEVYLHDLPKQICGLIEMTFRILTTSADTEKKEDEIELCEAALKYEMFLTNSLKALLIECYRKEIKRYRKFLKQFKHKAVVDEYGMPFMKNVEKDRKCIRKKFREGKKKYKQMYDLNLLGYAVIIGKFSRWEKIFPWTRRIIPLELIVKLEQGNEITELNECFMMAEDLVKDCEENYSTIIGNGYDASALKRLISRIPEIVAILLNIVAAMIIFKKW